MENRNNREDVHEASYAVGQLLYEWVIANYGFDGYRKIVENQIKVDSFEANIKKSLGISTQELYKKAASHIVAAFQTRLLNRSATASFDFCHNYSLYKKQRWVG